MSRGRTRTGNCSCKFLLTLHALVNSRALTVQEYTTHDYGVTAGMSRLLGEIERRESSASILV